MENQTSLMPLSSKVKRLSGEFDSFTEANEKLSREMENHLVRLFHCARAGEPRSNSACSLYERGNSLMSIHKAKEILADMEEFDMTMVSREYQIQSGKFRVTVALHEKIHLKIEPIQG